MKGGTVSEHTRALLAEACRSGSSSAVPVHRHEPRDRWRAVGRIGVALAYGLALSVAVSSFRPTATARVFPSLSC